jgi:hypothetical protein
MFFLPLRFSGDLLGLRRWSSRSSQPTRYWSSLQSFKWFRGVLIEFWAWNRFFPKAARKYQTCPVFPTFEFRAQIWWRPSLWCLEVMIKTLLFCIPFARVFDFSLKVVLCCPAYQTCLVAGPVFPDMSDMHTKHVRYQVRYCWQHSVQQLFLPRFVRLSSVLRSVYCVGLLPFYRPYLGALVTGWLVYQRFETLLLFYRSGVSRFLVFWFGTLSIFDPLALWCRCVPREHLPFSRVVVITVFVFDS